MQGYRWTVRNLDPLVLGLLWEVRETSGVPFGELLTEAIETWYQGLPEDEGSPSDSEDAALVHHLSEHYSHGQ